MFTEAQARTAGVWPGTAPLPRWERPAGVVHGHGCMTVDGTVYYADEKGLWRMTDDGASTAPIASGKMTGLNYAGGQLYYACNVKVNGNTSTADRSVYRNGPSGGSETKLVQLPAIVGDVWVTESGLLIAAGFDTKFDLYTCGLDGSGLTQVYTCPKGYMFDDLEYLDGWLYYQGEVFGAAPDKGLYRMRPDGSGQEKVTPRYVERFRVIDSKLFYATYTEYGSVSGPNSTWDAWSGTYGANYAYDPATGQESYLLGDTEYDCQLQLIGGGEGTLLFGGWDGRLLRTDIRGQDPRWVDVPHGFDIGWASHLQYANGWIFCAQGYANRNIFLCRIRDDGTQLTPLQGTFEDGV